MLTPGAAEGGTWLVILGAAGGGRGAVVAPNEGGRRAAVWRLLPSEGGSGGRPAHLAHVDVTDSCRNPLGGNVQRRCSCRRSRSVASRPHCLPASRCRFPPPAPAPAPIVRIHAEQHSPPVYTTQLPLPHTARFHLPVFRSPPATHRTRRRSPLTVSRWVPPLAAGRPPAARFTYTAHMAHAHTARRTSHALVAQELLAAARCTLPTRSRRAALAASQTDFYCGEMVSKIPLDRELGYGDSEGPRDDDVPYILRVHRDTFWKPAFLSGTPCATVAFTLAQPLHVVKREPQPRPPPAARPPYCTHTHIPKARPSLQDAGCTPHLAHRPPPAAPDRMPSARRI
ncbi:hypothetical protein GGX14DRAFT_575111 [Mycena pura]|uniref:Uncharacterized protein n=1 Tax=Mycena pura TaxID=153505 RepID=A0AAD6UW43_9AGAR|nr:hypothetical protein GGX14DRAFT_575111 [Mycena pura]